MAHRSAILQTDDEGLFGDAIEKGPSCAEQNLDVEEKEKGSKQCYASPAECAESRLPRWRDAFAL